MAKGKVVNILVLGATGKTGHQIVRYALETGYRVTVLVRDKSKLKLKYNNLIVIRGNVRNKKDVEKAVKDQNVIISSLGVRPGQNPVCREGIENIMESMAKLKVKRLIAVSAYGARETAKNFYGKVLNYFLKNIMRDKNEMEDLIEKSKLDWTVIRPVILTNAEFSNNYKIQTKGAISGGFHFISREDIARFIIDSLDNKEYKKKFVTIYN